MRKVDLLIIGGGSAGLAAAVEAYDRGIRSIIIIERGAELGGILNQCIHNGFGLGEFKEELTGPEFAYRFAKQVQDRNIECHLLSTVTSVTPNKVVTYVNEEEGSVEVEAKAIIMAAGCYERNAGAIGVPGDRPAGVLTAGQAQLMINKFGYLCGKRIFILGSGDIGLIMARRFTLEGAKVLGVAEIMPYSNGLNRNIVQCLNDYDIPLYLSHTVSQVIGKKHVEKVEISQVDEKFRPIPGTEKVFDCDALVLSIGLIPNNTLLSDIGVKVSGTKGAEVDQDLQTSLPGVFSCGNVLHVHDLVDNVVKEARIAGESAARYIQGDLHVEEYVISCAAKDGVGYILPQHISGSDYEKVDFKLRVRKPTQNVYIDFIYNGETIKRVFKGVIIPSEMEVISLPLSLFKEKKGALEVKLTPKEVNQ